MLLKVIIYEEYILRSVFKLYHMMLCVAVALSFAAVLQP